MTFSRLPALVFLLAGAFLVSCQKQYTPEEQAEVLSRLEVGKTTEYDVTQLAEQDPQGKYTDENGMRCWMYAFEALEPGPRGAPTRTRMVTLKFDKDGILREVVNEAAR